ncbi:MAG: mechanosensitive ion channel family protein [Rubricoccaceae bacterium]
MPRASRLLVAACRLLAAALLLAPAGPSASAQDLPAEVLEALAPGAQRADAPSESARPSALSAVRVDGRVLFRVGPVDSLSAEARAAQIERRVQRVLAASGYAEPVVRERSGDRIRLRVGDQLLLEVTPADAEERLMSVGALAADWAARLDEALAQGQAERGGAAQRLTTDVRAALASAFGRVAESAAVVLPRALAALLVLLLFWAIAAVVRRLTDALVPLVVRDQTTRNLVKQVSYYVVWALGLLVALGALGFAPEAAFTGLGLTGLVLGFALKDILSNFVSGLLLLALRPFKIGDQIVAGDVEGDVERIELRATQIRTYDGRVVLIPNAELFTSRLTNNTAAPVRRNRIEVWLPYSEDLGRAAEALLEAAQQTEGVLPEPPPSVRIRELTPAGVHVETRFWTDSRRSDYLATASLVRRRAVCTLAEAGVALATPTSLDVHLRRTEPPPAPLPADGRGEAALRADEDARLPPDAGTEGDGRAG